MSAATKKKKNKPPQLLPLKSSYNTDPDKSSFQNNNNQVIPKHVSPIWNLYTIDNIWHTVWFPTQSDNVWYLQIITLKATRTFVSWIKSDFYTNWAMLGSNDTPTLQNKPQVVSQNCHAVLQTRPLHILIPLVKWP